MVDLSGLKTEESRIWTKEGARINQTTIIEDKINYYKETQQWEFVLNSMEDYLRFQMEAMSEKIVDEQGHKKTVVGMETPTWKALDQELKELTNEWKQTQPRTNDPAARMNNKTKREELVDKIKELINKLYHNNVKFALTYQRKDDPMKAAYQ